MSKSIQPDSEYVRKRDELIPIAEIYADRNSGPRPAMTGKRNEEYVEWHDIWNNLFHQKMNQLAKEHGLTK